MDAGAARRAEHARHRLADLVAPPRPGHRPEQQLAVVGEQRGVGLDVAVVEVAAVVVAQLLDLEEILDAA